MPSFSRTVILTSGTSGGMCLFSFLRAFRLRLRYKFPYRCLLMTRREMRIAARHRNALVSGQFLHGSWIDSRHTSRLMNVCRNQYHLKSVSFAACAGCGANFEPKRSWLLQCSPRCRQRGVECAQLLGGIRKAASLFDPFGGCCGAAFALGGVRSSC